MRAVDTLVVVSDATSRGIQTVAVIKKMVQDDKVIKCAKMGVVFNRVQGNEELLKNAARDIGIDVLGLVPNDENIAHHDLVGKPLTELPYISPGFSAVRDIVKTHIIAR